MLVTPEEKEKLDSMLADFKKIADANNNYAETLVELTRYISGLVDELKVSNPALALRVMNKVTDIMERRVLNGN